jgi:hypothetical protein
VSMPVSIPASPGPLALPRLLYRVTWPNGTPHVLSSGLSSAAPLIGTKPGATFATSPTKDGLQLQVTLPAGTSGPVSVGALLTGVTFSSQGDYLLEATLTHAAGPTGLANYLWAIVLVLKNGNQNDAGPKDTRLSETLHFTTDSAGADIALVNMPGLQNLMPPATDPRVQLASADYSLVKAASQPAIDFTMALRLNLGAATGDATVAVNQHPGLGGKTSNYERHGQIGGPAQAVSYTTAGVVVVLSRGNGLTASAILKEFKISKF